MGNFYFWVCISRSDEASSFTHGLDTIDLSKRNIVQCDDASKKFDFENGHRAHAAGH